MSVIATPKPAPPGSKPASEFPSSFNMVLFGFGGSGKTSLLQSAQDTASGRDLYLFDVEKGSTSINDRDDIMAWRPGENGTWDEFVRTADWFKSNKHEYRTFAFETLGAMYDLALTKVMAQAGRPGQGPSQAEFGRANNLILSFMQEWVNLSVARGWNVIFTCHAEEVKDDNSIVIRMKVTPGIVVQIYRIVDTIGYLEVDQTGRSDDRRLLLKNTNRVIGKHRQPRRGPQLPTTIIDPKLGEILDHVHHVKTFPQTQQKG